jgi:hypothetical protein
MRDHDDRYAALAVHLARQREDVLAGPDIAIASRLVGRDDPWRVGEGMHDGTAPILAAAHGVSVRMIFYSASQSDAFQKADDADALCLTHAAMADDEWEESILQAGVFVEQDVTSTRPVALPGRQGATWLPALWPSTGSPPPPKRSRTAY